LSFIETAGSGQIKRLNVLKSYLNVRKVFILSCNVISLWVLTALVELSVLLVVAAPYGIRGGFFQAEP